jgi:O-glycosyl hydrolase
MNETLKPVFHTLFKFLSCIGILMMIRGVTPASGASITINGAATHQTVDGFGVNVNTTWWYRGAYGNTDTVRPAIDMLVNDLGATIIRAVIEEMDWEAVNDDGDPNNFNWSYYDGVFSNSKFQSVWNTLRYLNQKGIKDRLVISFMGTPPSWMGPNYGISSSMEDEFVETIAALLYYARHKAGIQFTLVSPMNETEQVRTGWYEGPNMPDAFQFVRVIRKLAIKLDTVGMDDIRFIAPDAASEPLFKSALSEMVKDPVIMSKLFCWGIHNYGKDSGKYINFIRGSSSQNKSFWVTETCGIANLFGQLDDDPGAFIFWDGFDSVYRHAIRHDSSLNTPPNDWCFWMKSDEGKPLIAYQASTRSWTPRKQFYEHAQLFKYIAPGAVRIGAATDKGNLVVYAYRNPDGNVVIVGRNAANEAIAVKGTLASLHVSPTLGFTYTTPTENMVKGTSVVVQHGGGFSVTLPARCVFTLFSGQGGASSPPSVGR